MINIPALKGDIMDKIDVAKVCHEANRAFCQTLGDYSQPPWEDAADWQVNSCINGVQLHLAIPHLPDSASHENWMKQKIDDGWIYGPKKDAVKKEHPCMVPFNDLPKDQKAKDTLFTSVVRALAPLVSP